MTDKMKMVFNIRDQYKTPIRGKYEDIKVHLLPIKEFLKTNPENVLSLVELPK